MGHISCVQRMYHLLAVTPLGKEKRQQELRQALAYPRGKSQHLRYGGTEEHGPPFFGSHSLLELGPLREALSHGAVYTS
jgi:hypothetical protein